MNIETINPFCLPFTQNMLQMMWHKSFCITILMHSILIGNHHWYFLQFCLYTLRVDACVIKSMWWALLCAWDGNLNKSAFKESELCYCSVLALFSEYENSCSVILLLSILLTKNISSQVLPSTIAHRTGLHCCQIHNAEGLLSDDFSSKKTAVSSADILT